MLGPAGPVCEVDMYKTRKRVAQVVSYIVALVLFLVIIVALLPVVKNAPVPRIFVGISAAVLAGVLILLASIIGKRISDSIEVKALYTGSTSLISEFIEKMRICYSLDDFYNLVADVLEQKADCSVLYTDSKNNYVLYNSPNRLTTSKDTMDRLALNYPDRWADGVFYLGEDNMGVVSSSKDSRGFFISKDHRHFYVFCRYTPLFDSGIFTQLYDEFCRFQNRIKTISDLSEIASLSKEWAQLADNQKSFLPPQMPKIDKLSVAAYYRPLVNVSGDYYTVLPIDEHKTLMMLGDVSGKGLAAALVMGLVMNTVKIIEDKEDLVTIVKAVDKAIKGMHLQDKYTVVFIGVVDTEKMTIRYINASMSDPLIITRAPDGYRIKPLTSNCSLVGILDIPDDLEPAEQRLFRGDVILMASDGVSEVMDENGVELGDTELYDNTIKSSAVKSPKEFIDDVVNLVLSYNGGKKLRDDLTMMVAKVEG